MTIILLALAAVVVVLVVVTSVVVSRDGYRAAPTDPGWEGREGPFSR